MIYKEAAALLDEPALQKKAFAKYKEARARQIYALVSQTRKNRTTLTAVIANAKLLQAEKRLKLDLALVMVHDLLFSKSQRIACTRCIEKDAVMRHKARLSAELVKYRLKHGVTEDVEPQGETSPVKWIRANPVKLDAQRLPEFLAKAGLTRVEKLPLKPKTFYVDDFVTGLCGVHPTFAAHKLPEYKLGQLIFQDRGSCFPVSLLLEGTSPSKRSKYIDACAAPGNKTSQIGAAAKHVDAFERDPARAKILAKMLATAGLEKRVQVHIGDFTKSDPSTYGKIDGIIVDPSCSGSGIFGRGPGNSSSGGGGEEESAVPTDEDRLQRLSEFQYIIVRHALSFDAQAVVYSTCSVHAQENEHVVRRLLETPEIASKWRLRPRERAMEGWSRRGFVSEFENTTAGDPEILADSCIRIERITDGGIGFFAAVFERIE